MNASKPKLTLVHTCSNCKQKEEIDISRIVGRFKRAWERIVAKREMKEAKYGCKGNSD